MKSEKGEIPERRTLTFIIMSIAFLFFFECTRELLGTIYNLPELTPGFMTTNRALHRFFPVPLSGGRSS